MITENQYNEIVVATATKTVSQSAELLSEIGRTLSELSQKLNNNEISSLDFGEAYKASLIQLFSFSAANTIDTMVNLGYLCDTPPTKPTIEK